MRAAALAANSFIRRRKRASSQRRPGLGRLHESTGAVSVIGYDQRMRDVKWRVFALLYLNDWCKYDRRFIAGLKKGKENRLASLREAAGYYRVARNFKKCDGEQESLQYALKILDEITNPVSDETVDDIVSGLASTFHVQYRQYNISAASKFLWLVYQSPVVIYDQNAASSLKECGRKTAECPYPRYRTRWRNEFAQHEAAIQSACKELVRVKDFSLAYSLSVAEICILTANRWFHERVFDAHLWRKGDERTG
jgi:hypothetical protein